MERTNCSCNPKYCVFTRCNVKFVSWHNANLNFNFVLKRDLPDVKYSMKTFYKFSNNEYRPVYVDTSIDYCENEKSGLESVLQEVLKKAWHNKTNFFAKCPVRTGNYYLNDWNPTATDLPSIVPAGRYLFNTFVFNYKESVLNTSVYFQVFNYGILDLNMG